MNKTIQANINGVMFNINENAYEILTDYLAEIKSRLDDNVDAEEVMADIESSIAEKLLAKSSDTNHVISETDVAELISVLGSVEDFDTELSTNKSSTKKTSSGHIKKLYRDLDNAVLGGVCSGLAAYFGIDPVLIRIIFIALIFAGGSGIFLYLALYISTPAAETAAQKLAMRGEPVTLATIEETAKQGVQTLKKKSKKLTGFKKFINLPFLILKNIFNALITFLRKLGPIFRWLIGLSISLFGLMTFFGLTVGTGFILFNSNSPYIQSDIPLTDLIAVFPYYWVIALTYLAIAIPAIFATILGISLIRKKNIFNFLTACLIFSVWLICCIALTTILVASTPKLANEFRDHPAIKTITKNYPFKNFSTITAASEPYGSNLEISYEVGPDWKVEAIGRTKDLERLLVNQDKDALNLNLQKSDYDHNKICLVCNTVPVHIKITAPTLTAIKTTGANFSADKLTGDNFTIAALSESYINLQTVQTKNFNLKAENNSDIFINTFRSASSTLSSNHSDITIDDYLSDQISLTGLNSSKFKLSGKAKTATIKLTNDSILSALNFNAATVKALVENNSVLRLNADKTVLEPETSGQSAIYYTGSPKTTNFSEAKVLELINAEDVDNSEAEDNNSTILYLDGNRWQVHYQPGEAQEFRTIEEKSY